jgi:hypothetical protein
MFLFVITLIAIAQLIQFIVAKNHETIDITIIDGWLGISPISIVNDNEYYSSNKPGNTIFSLVFQINILFILYFIYRCYYFFIAKQRFLLAISSGLYASVVFSSCFNRFFYNYGYDYIEIEYFMILNIEDVYLSLWRSTFFLLLVEAVPYLKQVKHPKQKIVEYSKWERAIWRNVVSRQKLFLQTHLKIRKKG